MSAAAHDPRHDTVVFPASGLPPVPLAIPADVTAPPDKPDKADKPDASVRVHIETVGGSYPRPELTSAAPGRTVFHGTGSAQMMAAVLRRVARQLDPPWWRRR